MLRVVRHSVFHLLAVLLIVTAATSAMFDLVPGDAAYAIVGEGATQEQAQRIRDELRLDEAFVPRYVDWVSNAVRGNLGESFRTNEAVTTMIKRSLPVTIELAALVMLLTLAVSIPLAMYTAHRAGRIVDDTTRFALSLILSSPSFLTGLVLVYVFGVRLRWLPVLGWSPLSQGITENLRSAMLPVLSLALYEIAVFARVLRGDLLETLRSNYILAARAKGLSTARVLFRHALRPSSFSLLTLSGLSLGRLMGGTIVVEVLFSLPGLGRLMIDAIQAKDFVVVQGVVAFVVVVYVVVNAIVDTAYRWLDPRVRE